jgi:hypothetical protein
MDDSFANFESYAPPPVVVLTVSLGMAAALIGTIALSGVISLAEIVSRPWRDR